MKMLGVALKGDPAALDATMSALYIQMAEEHGKDAFGPFITLAADTKNLPMVYHCTAGKDRTGIATALILRVLGVPEKTVVADYSQSNLAYDSLMKQVRGNPQLAALGVSPERLGPLMGVNPVWLTNALRHIETKYGSVENYLTTACGVEKKTLDSLRKTLLY
jgi:protein-tyrosine phosphatase